MLKSVQVVSACNFGEIFCFEGQYCNAILKIITIPCPHTEEIYAGFVAKIMLLENPCTVPIQLLQLFYASSSSNLLCFGAFLKNSLKTLSHIAVFVSHSLTPCVSLYSTVQCSF